MSQSPPTTNQEDSTTRRRQSEQRLRVPRPSKRVGKSGRSRPDHQTQPSFGNEVYYAELQEGSLCVGPTKGEQVHVNMQLRYVRIK